MEAKKINLIFSKTCTHFFVRSFVLVAHSLASLPSYAIQSKPEIEAVDNRTRSHRNTHTSACEQIPFIHPLGDTNLIEKLRRNVIRNSRISLIRIVSGHSSQIFGKMAEAKNTHAVAEHC